MITPGHIRRLLPPIIITLSTFFSISYSSGPIFEAPDEMQHYYYLRYLATVGEIPDVLFVPDRTLGSEMFEPPLYYAIAALIRRPLSDADFDEISHRQNKFHPNLIRLYASTPRPPVGNDNKNFWIHTRAEDFPYTASATALVTHLVRLLSVALGVGTLIFCFLIFRLLWPDNENRQIIALAIAAFWPLRLFMAGVINNDNLSALMSPSAFICCSGW